MVNSCCTKQIGQFSAPAGDSLAPGESLLKSVASSHFLWDLQSQQLGSINLSYPCWQIVNWYLATVQGNLAMWSHHPKYSQHSHGMSCKEQSFKSKLKSFTFSNSSTSFLFATTRKSNTALILCVYIIYKSTDAWKWNPYAGKHPFWISENTVKTACNFTRCSQDGALVSYNIYRESSVCKYRYLKTA